MWKYGAHIFLWIDRWSDDSVGLIEHAAELGLGCMEIAVGDDVEFTAATTRRAAEAAGVELTMGPGALWPMECDISDDDVENRGRGLRWHRGCIDRASEAGAMAYTGASYGHPGRVQKRRPPRDEMARTAEGLHLLAEHAQRRGMKLVIEPMSHFRTHLVNTPEQAMRLIEMADHANLRVLLDTYHLITEVRDYAAAVRVCGDRLWGVHACESDRGVPGGGLVPWDGFFGALRERQSARNGPHPLLPEYRQKGKAENSSHADAENQEKGKGDGHAPGEPLYVVLESYNSSLGDFAMERGMFHNVCPDGDAFVKQALAFIWPRLERSDKP